MCLGKRLRSDLSTASGLSQIAGVTALDSDSASVSEQCKLKVILPNVRGLRQAAGELALLANEFKPHLIGIVEAHLDGDPLGGLIPAGYRCISRMDRTKHGGGLVWLGLKHLLIDKVPLKGYNNPRVSEMLGIELMDETLILCYTPGSQLAPRLVESCQQYKLDNPFKAVSYFGDFNVHNPDWICSVGDLDAGGRAAEEMCQISGMQQLIDFPTRGGNTLDLVMTTHTGYAKAMPGAGTSDHILISVVLDLSTALPEAPEFRPTLLWQYAPWPHIRGM